MHIASLVMGITALLLSWIPVLGFILAIVALIIAIIAMVVKKAEEKGKGMKIAGIILSIIAVGVSAIVNVGSILLINTVVDTGKGLVDSALEGTGIDRVENNMDAIKENMESVITNNNQNNKKTSITADKFAEVMKEKGYVIYDHTSEYTQYGSHFLKMLVAEKDGHQIEFTVVTTSESAITGYNTNKAKFEEQKGNTSSYFTVSRDNYNTYTLTTNGMYKYLARVDNTLLYIDVAEEYKETVKNIVNELGY